jgi:hypothetical protein
MADTTQLPPQLVRYWVAGEGAGKIGWGTPGDFNRCRVAIQAAVVKDGDAPLSDRVLSGLCSNLHVLATGGRPGTEH